MYKVTIEGENLKEPMILEYAYVDIALERGLNAVYLSGDNSFGRPANLKPNGHSRANLKLWSGCDTYDGFIAKGETWESAILEYP